MQLYVELEFIIRKENGLKFFWISNKVPRGSVGILCLLEVNLVNIFVTLLKSCTKMKCWTPSKF